MKEIQERAEDYFLMGVRTVWIIDPKSRQAYLVQSDGQATSSMTAVKDFLTVPGTLIQVSVQEMFADFDDWSSGSSKR